MYTPRSLLWPDLAKGNERLYENENALSVTADLLLTLSNYTSAAGLEKTSQTSHAVLSQIFFI